MLATCKDTYTQVQMRAAELPDNESGGEEGGGLFFFNSFFIHFKQTAHNQNTQPVSFPHTLCLAPGLRLIASWEENNGMRNGINWPQLTGFNIHSIKEGLHSSPESPFTLHSVR